MPLARAEQHVGEDFAVLGLGAAAMSCCALLERANEGLIDVTHDESRHDCCSLYLDAIK